MKPPVYVYPAPASLAFVDIIYPVLVKAIGILYENIDPPEP